MRILIAHNRYQQRGGEDSVVDSEVDLLTSAGHDVHTLIVTNDIIKSPSDKIATMLRIVSNPDGVAAVSVNIERFRPNLVHVHNFFPLLSPAIYQACKAGGVPVVQTLHNYRTICANGLLLRKNQSCHLCVNGSTLWGVFHRCYRHSFAGSMALARMISAHKKRNTWRNDVDHYIALSAFSRRIFVEAGFPEHRITVKPNSIKDPGEVSVEQPRNGALYVGRLAEEKGLRVLLEASSLYNISVRIAGDGPDAADLKRIATHRITFLGALSREAVLKEIRQAAVVVLPSLAYEHCPNVILESFACATPVVGSRVGAIGEMIEDGVTGLLAPKENPKILGEIIRRVVTDPNFARKLGNAGRQVFLERFTHQMNLKNLEDIYGKVVSNYQRP